MFHEPLVICTSVSLALKTKQNKILVVDDTTPILKQGLINLNIERLNANNSNMFDIIFQSN